MLFFNPALGLILGAGAVVCGAVPAPVPVLEDRATSCTFTDAASATASKTTCATIVLSNIAVPAGKTLDLTGLKSGTDVCLNP